MLSDAASPEGVVIRHLEHLHVRNLRTTSIYNRRRVLARLRQWADGPVLYLSTEQLKCWQSDRAAVIGPGALRMEMSALREFYKWCTRERYRADNPMDRLDMPRVIRRLPRPISDLSLARALAGADPAMSAILGLGCFAGLRACEIARLDWSELDLAAGVLRVMDGKGGHGRIVPVSSRLAGLLVALPDRRGPVIRRLDGRPGHARPHRISARANDYLHSIGVPETLHQLRHRLATRMYAECRDIRAVQDVLGHASPTTTAMYAAVAPRVSRDAVEQAGRLAA